MENGKVTIHDIAKELNIDSSTVSRALSNNPRVKQKTKDRILEKANEMGYQRNLLASSLRNNKTNTIGVIVPRISRHFFSSAIAGIEETAYEAGYNVIICQSLEQLNREQKIANTLLANRVDGVLISVSMETTDSDYLQIFKKNGTPLVFFDRHCDIPGNSNVVIDDFQGGFDATEHLILQGCKKIAHFSGPQELEIYKNRFKGYKSALEKHNIKLDSNLVIPSKLMEIDGIESAKKLLSQTIPIDGIFSSNDTAAISALQYLKGKGIKIPEDIAIVGFSNEPISSVIEPSLTTIDQPGFEMGKIAANLLLAQINNKPGTIVAETIILKPVLIKRNSSKKISE
ncbi:LacI family DNA-binding transcriptional regulator [Flavobacterium alvei]|uniref:LacI family DNA-binding transcriptional regulator n=1 Tax=Flavobacterium alvei TaxID=2080416 RepID=UPI0026F01EEE|nr:LacI family DNA-binding transcriptional regulator [Flavobacterium alvei]